MHVDLPQLVHTYGYWAVGVVVGIESRGGPVPGETMSIAATTFAGATHHLDIELVVVATIVAAGEGSAGAERHGHVIRDEGCDVGERQHVAEG